jgi:hypothetical protein
VPGFKISLAAAGKTHSTHSTAHTQYCSCISCFISSNVLGFDRLTVLMLKPKHCSKGQATGVVIAVMKEDAAWNLTFK